MHTRRGERQFLFLFWITLKYKHYVSTYLYLSLEIENQKLDVGFKMVSIKKKTVEILESIQNFRKRNEKGRYPDQEPKMESAGCWDSSRNMKQKNWRERTSSFLCSSSGSGRESPSDLHSSR